MTSPTSRGPKGSLYATDLVLVTLAILGGNHWLGWDLSAGALLGAIMAAALGLACFRWPAVRLWVASASGRCGRWLAGKGHFLVSDSTADAAAQGVILSGVDWVAHGLEGELIRLPEIAEVFVLGALAYRLVPRGGMFGISSVRQAVVAAGVAVLLGVSGYVNLFPMTGFHAVFLAGWAGAIGAGWHALVGYTLLPPGKRWREHARLMAIVATGVVIFAPLLVPGLWGGLDARWYGYTMIDALQQERAGVFPVWAGQGEFMVNGAVHPIRTAPYHYYLGMLLDVATARSLTPLAIQHLTVVVTGIQTGVLTYLGLAALAPGRRTTAALLALVFLTAPLLASYVHTQEMYMTAMAFGFLPIVIHGNICSLEDDDPRAWAVLVAGLAAIWMCHAPVGFWTTLCSAALQGARLLTWDWKLTAWKRALGAGLGFAGLSLYYFVSILELAPGKTDGTGALAIAAPLLLAGVVGLLRFLVTRQRRWLALTAVAAIPTLPVQPAYGAWLLAAAAVGFGLGRFLRPKDVPLGQLASTLLVGAVMVSLLGGPLFPKWMVGMFDASWAAVNRNFPGVVSPISTGAVELADLQPGYGCWLLLAVAWWGAWRRRDRVMWLLCLVVSGLALLSLPVPGVTRALLFLVPAPLYGISGTALWLRFFPILGCLAVFAGALALLRDAVPLRPRQVVIALLLVVAWNLVEVRRVVTRGRAAVATASVTANYLRPEVARTYSYSYDNLPMPGYVVNGVTDYHLESRLLRTADQSVESTNPAAVGPPLFVQSFDSRPDQYDPHWLHLEPKLTLAPGERLALEFAFLPKVYAGSLVFRGRSGFYRDYALPSAGNGAKSFGVEAGRPKVLAIWNSTEVPEEVEMLYLTTADESTARSFGVFATVTAYRYSPGNLPVKVRSLVPYRAEVTLQEPMLLETPRVFVPGYAARVNGRPVAVEQSAERLAMIPLPPGRNEVELEFRGTTRLKAALTLSSIAWLALGWAALRRRRGNRSDSTQPRGTSVLGDGRRIQEF